MLTFENQFRSISVANYNWTKFYLPKMQYKKYISAYINSDMSEHEFLSLCFWIQWKSIENMLSIVQYWRSLHYSFSKISQQADNILRLSLLERNNAKIWTAIS